MLTVLFLAFLALPPADRDPRCNTAARYEAMAQGANCSGSEAWPKIPNQHKRHK
ncbi:MAG: hypothetical protein JWQ17_3347 [Tardiphaga sp.]|jgi:hypothetical protein|nr:hypothetical protein [Tardiphaga sp.]